MSQPPSPANLNFHLMKSYCSSVSIPNPPPPPPRQVPEVFLIPPNDVASSPVPLWGALFGYCVIFHDKMVMTLRPRTTFPLPCTHSEHQFTNRKHLMFIGLVSWLRYLFSSGHLGHVMFYAMFSLHFQKAETATSFNCFLKFILKCL